MPSFLRQARRRAGSRQPDAAGEPARRDLGRESSGAGRLRRTAEQRSLHGFVALLALVVATACSRPAPPNLLLISLDTLRADRLGCYGYERPTSPSLDALAREGAVFETVLSQSPWTVPSHATMLTGTLPMRHGVTGAGRILNPDVPTLASLLADAGYDTCAVVKNVWFRRQPGFQRGFEHFDASPAERSKSVTEQALEWLGAGREAPFFLFLHYYDVHSDYTPAPRERALLVEPYDGPMDGSTAQLMEVRAGTRTLSPADARHVSELYDAEIRQLDGVLGELFAELERRGLAANTVVMVTSDHGEEFLEHGGVLHGRTAYEEVLRVPLLVRGPGVPQGRRVPGLAMVADIVPTALALLGVQTSATFDGIDLVPRLLGKPSSGEERRVYAGADHGNAVEDSLSMLRDERFKLVQDRHTPRVQLFDLEADPEELVDVAAEHPEVVRELLALLESMRAGQYVGEEAAPLGEDDAQALRGLGY